MQSCELLKIKMNLNSSLMKKAPMFDQSKFIEENLKKEKKRIKQFNVYTSSQDAKISKSDELKNSASKLPNIFLGSSHLIKSQTSHNQTNKKRYSPSLKVTKKYESQQKFLIEKQERGDKTVKEKAKSNILIINLLNTHYNIMHKICAQQSFRAILNLKTLDISCKDTKIWDIVWKDGSISSEYLLTMNKHQKINYFPGISAISRKNNLVINIYKMKRQFYSEYDFIPRTFIIPKQYSKLKLYFEQAQKKHLLKTFIVKPEADCQGRGIYLTQSISKNDLLNSAESCVVQKYIINPMLTSSGLKFDLRVYVLLYNLNPLKIFIYQQGLVRFATQKYQYPNKDNLNKLQSHLTNYSINKSSSKYIFNSSVYDLNEGHKQSLAQFFTELKNKQQKQGLEPKKYWNDIKDQVVKTIIAGLPDMRKQYQKGHSQMKYDSFDHTNCYSSQINNLCFQILGFDFLLDNRGKSFLLEVNQSPSLATDTPLDTLIKGNLIKDTLSLVSNSIRTKKKIINIQNQFRKKKIGKTKKLLEQLLQSKKKSIIQIFLQDQKFQRYNMGSFSLIYPSTKSHLQKKYDIMIQFALINHYVDKYNKGWMKRNNVISGILLFQNNIRTIKKQEQSKSKEKKILLNRLKPINRNYSVMKTLQPQIAYEQQYSY